MKKFILKTIAFSILLFIAPFLIIGINNYYANFKIGKDKEILIVGHSHPECAFNDSLISGVANYAQSGEAYFYTYFKTKKLLEQNPNIHYVLIEFTNNLVTESSDKTIWEDKYINFRLPRYGSFMDSKSLYLLYKKNPTAFKNNLIPLLRHSAKMTLKKFDYRTEIGGYMYLERDKTDSILNNKTFQNIVITETEKLPNLSMEYLEKIIKLCYNRKVKVLFVRSPLHKESFILNNEIAFKNVLHKKFSNIELLDFSKFPLQNSEFGDLNHVNNKGAKIFSIWFNHILKEGLLNKTNKQTFIDEEILIKKNKKPIFVN